jgi:hypothetical protein
MLPVEGYRGLYRDENSNAILNCNKIEYENYLQSKNKKILEKKEISDLKSEIEDLKKLVDDLLKLNNK